MNLLSFQNSEDFVSDLSCEKCLQVIDICGYHDLNPITNANQRGKKQTKQTAVCCILKTSLNGQPIVVVLWRRRAPYHFNQSQLMKMFVYHTSVTLSGLALHDCNFWKYFFLQTTVISLTTTNNFIISQNTRELFTRWCSLLSMKRIS